MINDHEEKFFHGFTPVWALTLFGIAIMFVIIFIAGIICHAVGCRRSREDSTNDNSISTVEQPLIVENLPLQSNQIIKRFDDDQF